MQSQNPAHRTADASFAQLIDIVSLPICLCNGTACLPLVDLLFSTLLLPPFLSTLLQSAAATSSPPKFSTFVKKQDLLRLSLPLILCYMSTNYDVRTMSLASSMGSVVDDIDVAMLDSPDVVSLHSSLFDNMSVQSADAAMPPPSASVPTASSAPQPPPNQSYPRVTFPIEEKEQAALKMLDRAHRRKTKLDAIANRPWYHSKQRLRDMHGHLGVQVDKYKRTIRDAEQARDVARTKKDNLQASLRSAANRVEAANDALRRHRDLEAAAAAALDDAKNDRRLARTQEVRRRTQDLERLHRATHDLVAAQHRAEQRLEDAKQARDDYAALGVLVRAEKKVKRVTDRYLRNSESFSRLHEVADAAGTYEDDCSRIAAQLASLSNRMENGVSDIRARVGELTQIRDDAESLIDNMASIAHAVYDKFKLLRPIMEAVGATNPRSGQPSSANHSASKPAPARPSPASDPRPPRAANPPPPRPSQAPISAMSAPINGARSRSVRRSSDYRLQPVHDPMHGPECKDPDNDYPMHPVPHHNRYTPRMPPPFITDNDDDPNLGTWFNVSRRTSFSQASQLPRDFQAPYQPQLGWDAFEQFSQRPMLALSELPIRDDANIVNVWEILPPIDPVMVFRTGSAYNVDGPINYAWDIDGLLCGTFWDRRAVKPEVWSGFYSWRHFWQWEKADVDRYLGYESWNPNFHAHDFAYGLQHVFAHMPIQVLLPRLNGRGVMTSWWGTGISVDCWGNLKRTHVMVPIKTLKNDPRFHEPLDWPQCPYADPDRRRQPNRRRGRKCTPYKRIALDPRQGPLGIVANLTMTMTKHRVKKVRQPDGTIREVPDNYPALEVAEACVVKGGGWSLSVCRHTQHAFHSFTAWYRNKFGTPRGNATIGGSRGYAFIGKGNTAEQFDDDFWTSPDCPPPRPPPQQ